jgi:hypothetical protein
MVIITNIEGIDEMKKIIISAAILITTLGIAYRLFVRSIENIEIPSTMNEATIFFPELNESIYIRAKAWGLGGNHQEIILSASPIDKERQSVKGKDIIFYTTEIYYKKKGLDTLFIYADASTIGKLPNDIKTSVNIVTVGLKNYVEVKEYEQNYEKYDLKKISVYNE